MITIESLNKQLESLNTNLENLGDSLVASMAKLGITKNNIDKEKTLERPDVQKVQAEHVRQTHEVETLRQKILGDIERLRLEAQRSSSASEGAGYRAKSAKTGMSMEEWKSRKKKKPVEPVVVPDEDKTARREHHKTMLLAERAERRQLAADLTRERAERERRIAEQTARLEAEKKARRAKTPDWMLPGSAEGEYGPHPEAETPDWMLPAPKRKSKHGPARPPKAKAKKPDWMLSGNAQGEYGPHPEQPPVEMREGNPQGEYGPHPETPDWMRPGNAKGKFGPPKPKKEGDTPAPKKGMVRFYHGGQGGGGARWFSPDLAYAQGYADKGEGATVSYIDLPENSPLLKKAFDDSGTTSKAPYMGFEAPEEIAKQRKPYRKPKPKTIPIAPATPDWMREGNAQGEYGPHPEQPPVAMRPGNAVGDYGPYPMATILTDEEVAQEKRRAQTAAARAARLANRGKTPPQPKPVATPQPVQQPAPPVPTPTPTPKPGKPAKPPKAKKPEPFGPFLDPNQRATIDLRNQRDDTEKEGIEKHRAAMAEIAEREGKKTVGHRLLNRLGLGDTQVSGLKQASGALGLPGLHRINQINSLASGLNKLVGTNSGASGAVSGGAGRGLGGIVGMFGGGGAGGGGAGAAASGAAGGSGAGILAALATPTAAVVAGLVALGAAAAATGAALTLLPGYLRDLGSRTLELNRVYTDASGRMAQIFAQVDISRYMMRQQTGSAISPSAQYLASSQIRLERSLQEQDKFFGTIQNLGVGVITDLLGRLNELVGERIFGVLNRIFERMGLMQPSTDEGNFGDWLDKIARRDQRLPQAPNNNFLRNPGAGGAPFIRPDVNMFGVEIPRGWGWQDNVPGWLMPRGWR